MKPSAPLRGQTNGGLQNEASDESNKLPILFDAFFGGGLLAVLFLVYLINLAFASSDSSDDAPEVKVLEEVKTTTREVAVEKPLRLAVTPAEFDDMGRLLEELGEGYRYVNVTLDDLLDKERTTNFDVIFLTCGGHPDHWLGEQIARGERNSAVYGWNPAVKRRMTESLRNFVRQGGTLYASDWRFQMVSAAFPELLSRPNPATGDGPQQVDAEIVDPGLRELLGEKIELRFDLSGWYPAAFSHSEMTTYMHGEYRALRGGRVSSPLLVKVPFGEGAILFTSFHNEKQTSKAEKELLKYLVFATVTSKIETEVKQTMVKGGFSPRKHSLLSTSKGAPSVTKTYVCDKTSDLQFVLAFENRGAKLRLSVVSPSGKKAEQVGTSTIRIDVPAAKPGNWKYTVTAEKVPYENFPFTLTVGEK